MDTGISASEPVVHLCVADRTWALPVRAVERVVRAVEISSCPAAPPVLLGIVNVAGATVPIYDLSRRGAPRPEVALEDKIVFVRARGGQLAGLWAQDVTGVIHPRDLSAPAADGSSDGPAPAAAGPPVQFQDPDQLLTPAEERQVAESMGAP